MILGLVLTAEQLHGRKQLRLAKDQAEQGGVQDLRRQWSIQLAQLRNQTDEASVETAQIGHRKHIEFLERKLAAPDSGANHKGGSGRCARANR